MIHPLLALLFGKCLHFYGYSDIIRLFSKWRSGKMTQKQLKILWIIGIIIPVILAACYLAWIQSAVIDWALWWTDL